MKMIDFHCHCERSNLAGKIAELVPRESEESRSEFAWATPRKCYAPRNDLGKGDKIQELNYDSCSNR